MQNLHYKKVLAFCLLVQMFKVCTQVRNEETWVVQYHVNLIWWLALNLKLALRPAFKVIEAGCELTTTGTVTGALKFLCLRLRSAQEQSQWYQMTWGNMCLCLKGSMARWALGSYKKPEQMATPLLRGHFDVVSLCIWTVSQYSFFYLQEAERQWDLMQPSQCMYLQLVN